ncbi:hypothetical protein CSIM01_01673 [Colletotrichum simmondsii]|uniref:C2H2-type domain-containing protein n=1 Tax=Colletotrichum simmondsii TaxID=703756 RepID=A0A135TRS5_9PEZI|nr:hypothetical protein CSIM01_01673 [Colletotrichum simmondsii]
MATLVPTNSSTSNKNQDAVPPGYSSTKLAATSRQLGNLRSVALSQNYTSMMENSMRTTAELSRLSRDTLHPKEIPEFHVPNYRAGRLLTNASHLASKDFGTRLLLQRNLQSTKSSHKMGFRTERLIDSGNCTTKFLPLTTEFDLEASLEFAHYGLQFSRGGFYPMAMDQHDFPRDTKTCRQPGITRHSLAVQGRSSEIVSGKTGRKTFSISYVGVPRENSAGGDLVTHRGQDASPSIPIEKRRPHTARPDKVYRDISPISSRVADKTDFQGRALSMLVKGYRWFQAKSLETCRNLVSYLQWLFEPDARPFTWSCHWKLASSMEYRSCPSPSQQETETGPTYNTCQHSRETSEEKPSEHRSRNTGSPRRKRGACQHETNGQDQSDDDEFPDESRRKKSRLQGPATDKNDNDLSLACPFYKADKRTHNRCSLLQLNRIRDVKQHLYRKHMQPHYCSRCGRQFETQTEERCHTRQQDCSKRANQPPDGITHDQQKELKERVDRKLAVKEQWFAVWAIVFPDMPPPESPYVYSPTREVATNMRNYWQESAAEMLVAHADRMPGIDRERVIGGLNTFMETFFNRFIEEHTSVAEGEQVSDSSSDGSPGTAFLSGRAPAISSPSSSQRTISQSLRDLLSVVSGAASDNVMIDDGSLIANYSMTMGETEEHWEFPSGDDAYGWGQPFFHGDPLT